MAVPFTDGVSHYALVLGVRWQPTNAILQILACSLLVFGVAGVVVAGLLGCVIARSGLEPIQRLTAAVTRVTDTDQLAPLGIERHGRGGRPGPARSTGCWRRWRPRATGSDA